MPKTAQTVAAVLLCLVLAGPAGASRARGLGPRPVQCECPEDGGRRPGTVSGLAAGTYSVRSATGNRPERVVIAKECKDAQTQ